MSQIPAQATHDAERQELDRLLQYPGISRSANLVRLLTYVCEKQFEGKTDDLRESSIAIHALGRRKEDFDPQVDPIVRVTARTLRQRLADYYRQEGHSHELELELPTGQYVPRFVRRAAPVAPSVSAERLVVDEEVAAAPIASVPSVRPRGWLARSVFLAGALAACALAFWAGRASRALPAGGTAASCPCGVWGNPVWSDEFEGPKGAFPDPATWGYEVGNNGGWGNLEQEIYCHSGSSDPSPCSATRPNAYLDGAGNLVIEARRQGGNWTSARLTTRARRELHFGRIEARMKLPVGAGLWPAFWMLGSDVEAVSWPGSGSITIAENVPQRATSNGLGPTMVRSTVHGPGYFGGNGLWQNFTLPEKGRVDDAGYHVYGVIWSPEMVQFYVDDVSNVFFVITAGHLPTGGRWVFDHPFFMVLNLAVGGQWPGPPDSSTPDPARVYVDYIRHYQPSRVAGPKMTATTIAVRTGETASSTIKLVSALGTGRVSLSCAGAPAGSDCVLSPSVVDFTSATQQTATLTLATASSPGPSRTLAPTGSYRLGLTAITVSGDRSSIEVPATISRD